MGQESSERVQLMLDLAPIAIAIYNIKSRKCIDCNLEAVRLFGFTSKSECIIEFNERFSRYQADIQPCGTAVADLVNRVFERSAINNRQQLEWTHIAKDGEVLPVESTFISTTHKGEAVLVAYVRDLRNIKKAEANEKEATKWRNMLYETSPLLVEIWEVQGGDIVLVDCNDRASRLFGVSNKNDYIRDYIKFMPEFQSCGTKSKEKIKQVWDQVHKNGKGTFEFMHLNSKGEELPLEFTFVSLSRADKPVLVGHAYDLRQIKNAEKQRAEFLEESNRIKTQFLARMSHEIRTPISAVLGISEVELLNPNPSLNLKESFAKIHNSASILLGIVNDILDLSRIEADKLDILCEEYDTASLISDIAHTHLSYLGNRDIKFKVLVSENLPCTIAGDALRIKQIMNNLLSNAFKYTESGEVIFSVAWVNESLSISIRDTGLGMSQEQVYSLQNAGDYARFHVREMRHIDGAGLGMPIVYHLVHMMGGKIDLESEVKKGTHVYVHIPQKIIGAEVLGKELSNNLERFELESWSAAKNLDFKPEPMPYGRVLVVDDIEVNLYVAEAMLEFFKLNIELCESGREAISKIEQGNEYDIIFMDHMMPEMDGVQVTKTLREMGYNHPIVALTANAIKGQDEMFMSSGFSGFMSKPIDIEQLNTYLLRFIKNKL